MTSEKPVTVMQLPSRLTVGQVDLFFTEVTPYLKAERPRIVFDFSGVSQLDSAGIEMLLCCMEEAMMRNGDLKLACIPPGPAAILELTRTDRLFETFDTTADAVQSFHRFPVRGVPAVSGTTLSSPNQGNNNVTAG